MRHDVITPALGTNWTTTVRSRSTAGEYATFPVVSNSLQEMIMQAFSTFVAAVRSIPTVEQVRGQVAGAYVHIVTYLSGSTLEERSAVYAAQMRLYDQFPDLRLEFDAIDREGYPVEGGELTGKYVEVIRELPDRVDADALHESN